MAKWLEDMTTEQVDIRNAPLKQKWDITTGPPQKLYRAMEDTVEAGNVSKGTARATGDAYSVGLDRQTLDAEMNG